MVPSAHRSLALVMSLAFAGCSDDASTGGGGTAGAGTGGTNAGGTSAGGTNAGGAPSGGMNAGGGGGANEGGAGGAAATTKRVFVTSATYTGEEIGDLDGGDAKCQGLADTAGLGGTWRAWLSETTFNGDPNPPGPPTRFAQSTEPYVLVGGEQIAPDWAGLVDGSIDAPIDRDETGTPIPDTPTAWTGTMSDGTSVSPCCNNWMPPGSGGVYGSTTATDGTWSFESGQPCSGISRLYCFEQ